MSHHRTVIATSQAPAALGPYSQANKSGNMVFVSGQLGLDPASGNLVEGGVRAQTRRSLDNITAILAEAGTSLADVVSCTVYLKDMNDFAEMNAEYATYFTDAPPSRATIEVARLPKDGLVEIACIAVLA